MTHFEGKTDRSVMKLTFREQLKNGNYRVIYQGDFRDDTCSECIEKWLGKWGDVQRGGNANGAQQGKKAKKTRASRGRPSNRPASQPAQET